MNTCTSVSHYTSAENILSSSTSSGSSAINSPPSSAGIFSGNFVVRSFISTDILHVRNFVFNLATFFWRTERFPPSASPLCWRSLPVLLTIYRFAGISSSLNRPLVVGPGYSPIPEKLVTKIRSGQFVDMVDLLGENLKTNISWNF